MMTSSAVSAILNLKTVRSAFFAAAACGALSSCAPYAVKENLSSHQIIETQIIRRPSGEKTLGFLPKYDRFLEGYIQGGLLAANGKAIPGVPVTVQDDAGNPLPEFQPGVTDQDGRYRIRFSLPLRWGILDYEGKLSCLDGWKIIQPVNGFRLYYSRSSGVLAYSSKELWVPVRNDAMDKKLAQPKPAPAPPPAPKKQSDDFGGFGDFNFGP
jgi:hypothetical protein